MAGGFEEDADRSRIIVQRINPDGTRQIVTVNLSGVERSGDMSQDIGLGDRDLVFVPRADEVSVLGQVTSPGSFVMKAGRALTLLRAIAQSGGFTRLARPASIVWVRKSGDGVQTVTVDAEAILQGRDSDPELSPGDILFVPERAW
jgi:protein involved in polysaccharide export with SLBB domain